MTSRLVSFMQIRPGESVLVALVASLFAFIQAGQGIGANAADGLFFVRFGVDYLPYMFMVLGVLTFFVTLVYSAGLVRIDLSIFISGILISFAVLLLLERVAILSELRPLYPLVWLSINIINAILGTLIWYIAGEVCDTRQAKRLFSIFASAGILGGVLGNLITGLLAKTLGTENLIVLYAMLVLFSLFLARRILLRFLPHRPKRTGGENFISDLRAGYDYVRRHWLLKLTAYASVLFSILYFSISFPFSQVVSHSFANEADVAGFLGLFSSAATAITFLISLLVANRLYARIGFVNAILILPVVYLGGFFLWSANFALATAVLARLAQMVILGGVASTAWSALFNVVPAERRGQVLGFDAGVPSQVGVVLSGVLLILGERVLNTNEIFILGMAVALACGVLVWRMREAYGEALIHALRAGRYEVFGTGARGFGSFRGNASAIQVASNALRDGRASTRRLAVEILARMNAASAVPALINALDDSDVEVRVASLQALGELDARDAANSIIAKLSDREPAIRARALKVLAHLQPGTTPAFMAMLQGMLNDPDVSVRAEAAVALVKAGQTEQALDMLKALVGDPDPQVRVQALDALDKLDSRNADRVHGEGFDFTPVLQAASDPVAVVRRAACQTLGRIQDKAAVESLIGCLNDPDATVRGAAAVSLRGLGVTATGRVLQVLSEGHDRAQDAALDALSPDDPQLLEPLSEYASREIAQAQTWRALASVIPAMGKVTRLVREMLENRAAQSEERLVKAVGLLGHREAMDLVAKSLKSRNPELRAEAVETLETLGNKRLARAIIPLLDEAPAPRGGQARFTPAEALAHLMTQRDDWARALASRAAAELALPELIPNLRVLEQEDPNLLPREAAHEALVRLDGTNKEGMLMETLQTVSSLERILLLREVPLFSELSPDDLKQIAEIAREQFYPDGAVLCREGEEGNELYVLAVGQVRVLKKTNGNERVLATRGVGEFVGEMAIIESAPRSATVRAEGEVRALVIDGKAFKSILRDRPEVSLAVLRALSRRLRERE